MVDTLEFAPVQLAQSARRIVYFTNGGQTKASHLAAKIDGPDAASFMVTGGTTSIPVGGIAVLEIDLAGNGTVGDKHAQLHFGGVTIDLVGHEVAPGMGLLSTSANIEFLTSGGGYSQQLNISNQSSSTLALTDVSADADGLFANGYYHYITQLPAFGQGQVNVDLAVTTTGCGTGVLHLHSDQATVDVPVSGEYVPIAHVMVQGDGQGTVTSDPAVMSCSKTGGVCDALVPGTSLRLTATPQGSDHFNGWIGQQCGTDPVCTLTTGTLEALTAQAVFAPADDKPIQITVAGGGLGFVRTTTAPSPCTGSCTFYVPGGGLDPVQLVAMPFSQFEGWSGDCSGTQTTCDLSVLTDGHSVTATFAPDPHETGSRAFPATYGGMVAALPGGDLIALGSSLGMTRLSRLAPNGSVVWTRPLLYNSFGLVTSAGGIIYVTGQAAIYALDANGKLLWSIPSTPNSPVIATFGEDVVVGGYSVSVYSAVDGSLKWSVPGAPQAVAANASVLAVASLGVIHRYATDGSEMLPAWTTPRNAGASSMSFDATGDLVVLSPAVQNSGSVSSPAVLSKLSPTGTLLFSSPLDSTGDLGGGQVLALANGDIAALRDHYSGAASTHDQVEAYDPNGALLWSIRKGVGWTTGDVHFPFGFQGQLVANPSGGFWLLGSYSEGAVVLETFTP